MINSIKIFLKKILPPKIKKHLSIIYFSYLLKKVEYNHKKALARVREKERVKVAFFLINIDTWKYDSVYKLLAENSRFEPIVIICPFVSMGKAFITKEIVKSEDYCIKMRYNYYLGYDIETQTSVNIKKIVRPDIVFFTNPNNLTTEEFLISNFNDTLTCYTTYSFRISKHYQYEYNHPMLNLVWINFCESEMHKNLTIKYAKNKGINTVVTGFPHLDNFKGNAIQNVWKAQTKPKKRIIWAPHWTIKNYQKTGHDWSCFLDYSEVFLQIANDFNDEIQLALKPHPFLKSVLENEALWGPEKTELYFKKWDSIDNCQLIEGEYIDLFKDSDALIHDSGGFIIEYMMINKPAAFLLNDRALHSAYNEVGLEALYCHQLIRNKSQLIEFINGILNDIDYKKDERMHFKNHYLITNNNSASTNIIKELINRLKWED